MTLDRTLKTSGGLNKKRSVMTRAERIAIMMEEDEFAPTEHSPLGLRKVKSQPDINLGPLTRLNADELAEKLREEKR
jgi:small basic protein (TIGR04137 family)